MSARMQRILLQKKAIQSMTIPVEYRVQDYTLFFIEELCDKN